MTERERLKLAIDNILRICLSDSSISAQNFINQIEAELATIIPYDHESKEFHLACGIELPDKDKIIQELHNTDHNKTSKVCESFESICTKRQLAVLFVGTMMSMIKSDGLFGSALEKTKVDLEKLMQYQSEIEEEVKNIPEHLSEEEKDKEFDRIMKKYLNK